jgi:energy-coupling factor transporter ATP-binding protein EcfA2
MKLKFKDEFEKYLSITSSFEIPEFKDFNVITGINGSGKTHFLKAVEKNFIEINIDGELIPPDEINFFDFETFKLNNQQSVDRNSLEQDRRSILDPLSSVSPFNDHLFQDSWPILVRHFNFQEYEKFFVIGKLIELKNQNDLNSLDEIPELKGTGKLERIKQSITNETILSKWKSEVNKLKDSKPRVKEYLGSVEDLSTLSQDDFNDIYTRHQDSNFLAVGFGKIFRKVKESLDRKYHDENFREATFEDTDKKFQNEISIFPWEFMNQIFESFKEGEFQFKYKTKRPTELSSDKLIPKIINTKTDEAVNFEDLSSGEKVLMALTLFLFQAEKNTRFPKVLLLDEIDATLHPSMCKNLLRTLKENIISKGVKIIFATHNSSTVAHCDEVEDGIFIKEENGIKESGRPEALEILSDGYVTLNSIVLQIDEFERADFIGISEGMNFKYLNKAKEFFAPDLNIKFIGFKKDFGVGAVRNLFDFLRRLNTNKTIFYIWDCDYKDTKDTEKLNNAGNKKNIPIILEKNQSNKIATNGIENMFPEEVFNKMLPGEVFNNSEAHKKRLLQKIIKEGTDQDFVNFSSLFEEIKRYVK